MGVLKGSNRFTLKVNALLLEKPKNVLKYDQIQCKSPTLHLTIIIYVCVCVRARTLTCTQYTDDKYCC